MQMLTDLSEIASVKQRIERQGFKNEFHKSSVSNLETIYRRRYCCFRGRGYVPALYSLRKQT